MKEYLVEDKIHENDTYVCVKANSPVEAKKLALERNSFYFDDLTVKDLKASECKSLTEREAQVRDERAEWFHLQ